MPLNPAEKLTREEIRQLQLERLQTTLNRAYFNVDFYRNRMDSLKLLPEDVSTFEDLRLVIHTRHGVGEQLEVLLTRSQEKEFLQGGRSQYLEALRGHVRRALGLGARIQLVERDRLPKEGLIRKTIFKNTGTLYDRD